MKVNVNYFLRFVFYEHIERNMQLVLPMALSALIIYSLNLVDYAWVKYLSNADVALVALIDGSITTFLYILMNCYSDTLLSFSVRLSNDHLEHFFSEGILISFFVSIAVVIVGILFFHQIWFFLSGNQLQGRADHYYYVITLTGFPISLVNTVLSTYLRAEGDTKYPSFVSTVAIVFNTLIDPFMIFVVFHAGFTAVVGIACSIFLSKILYLGLIVIKIKEKSRDIFALISIYSCVYLKKILKNFIPSCTIEVMLFLSGVVLFHFLSSYGVSAIAAYGLCMNILLLGYVVLKNLSIVFLIRMREQPDNLFHTKKILFSISIVAILFVIVCYVVLILFGKKLLFLLLASESSVSIAYDFLMLSPIFLLSYFFNSVLTSCFLIIEKIKYGLLINFFFSWLVNVPIVMVLTVFYHSDTHHIWVGMAMASFIRLIVSFAMTQFLVSYTPYISNKYI